MSNALLLKIFRNGQLVDHKTLSQEVIKIGKLRSSHLCLDDDSVARMHAVIESSGSDVRVIDLGSNGGTFLNGRRVEKNATVAHGDALNFGPYRVEVELMQAATMGAAGFGAPAFVPDMGRVAPTSIPTAAPRVAGATAVAPQVIAPLPIEHARTSPPGHDTSEVEVQDGNHVTEVIASYRGTVLDAQHVGQVKSRRNSAPLFLGAAAALMLGGVAILGAEVTQDWETYATAKTAAVDSGATMPAAPGNGLGGLGMAMMLLGLVPMGLGVVRLNDRGVSTYRIGEGHDAEFHTPAANLPDGDAFPLVSGAAGGHVLNFTPTMTGQVSMGGQSISLTELVGSGRAANNGNAYAYALPAGARCVVQHGDLTFHVNEVAAGKRLASKSEADKPFWAYNAASLAAIGSLLVMTHLIPDDSMNMGLEDSNSDSRFVGYMTQPDLVDEEIIEDKEPTKDQDEAGGTGKRDAGAEGSMGDPREKATNKRYAMKDRKTETPRMARDFDPDMEARSAGILGQLQKESGHFLASPYGAVFASGVDDDDIWGNMTGTEVGAAFGNGGHGLVGTGRGGGGDGEGTIGMGLIGLIGHGGGNGTNQSYGNGDGDGRGKTTAFGPKEKRVPRVRMATAITKGGIDKDIIRRVVRNHFREVVGCYNQGLVGDPNLRGRIAIQFGIGPTGKVSMSTVESNTTGDANTGRCIATAVKRWTFPKPTSGGTAIVTYPFLLNPA